MLTRALSRAVFARRGVVPTTWNPSDKSANVTLSNGNLTTAIVTDGLVRSIASVNSGKWYWEVTCGTNGDGLMPGVMVGGTSTTGYPGAYVGGYGYLGVNGNKYTNASPTAYGATFAAGNIVSVLLDLDKGTVTFWKNGASQGIAYSGLSGTLFAAIGRGSSSPTGTANFGATPFIYEVPSDHYPGFGILA